MPSVEKNETKSHYLNRCIPMLIKEGKKKEQAVAQCLNMFKEKWKAKGNILPPDDSSEFAEILANFNWDDCTECIQRENEERYRAGIFEIDVPNKKF